jgi:lipid-A-disaccharide synthase-like uncharacterized protein
MSSRKDLQKTKNRRKRGTSWFRKHYIVVKNLTTLSYEISRKDNIFTLKNQMGEVTYTTTGRAPSHPELQNIKPGE